MKLKKLLALLLALVMVFSLAACASKDKDDADEKEDEKTEQTDKKDDTEEDKDKDKEPAPAAKPDYHALVDAMLAFVKDPTSETMGYAAGGTVGGEEMEAFLDFFLEMAGVSVADIFPATEVGDFEDPGADALDDAALKAAQEKLDSTVAEWTDMRDSLKEESAAAADADWEEIATSLGMSVDEAKAFINDMLGVLDDLIAAFDGQTITEGYSVKAETNEMEMYLCGDKWFSELLFNFD